MDLTRLKMLRELAGRQTMAAVAEALFVSASAVSQQLAQLEDEVGVSLFERRGRGVSLTPAGENLVAHAERIFRILEEAKTDIAELKKIVAGELRVSAFPSVASSLIPQAMRKMEQEHPRLNITLNAMEPVEGLAALRAWQADLAIIDDITIDPANYSNAFEIIHLCDDHLFAMLPLNHPLAKNEEIKIAELRNDKWALDVASNTYSNVIMNECRKAGFEPVVNGNCNGFEVVVALIEAGCSVTVMPGLRLKTFSGRVKVKPLVPKMRRQIFAAIRHGESRNPAIAAFMSTLSSVARAYDAA